MTDFSEQLAAARKAASMTQEELAAAVHVTRATISSWERGRTHPDVKMVQVLAETLQCDFTFFQPPPPEENAVPEEMAAEPSTENMQDEAETGETAAVPVPAASETATESRGSRKRWLIPVVCGAAAVVVACLFLFVLPAMNRPAESGDLIVERPDAVEIDVSELRLAEPKRFTQEWFREGNIPARGEPYLVFSSRVEVLAEKMFDPYWHYYLGFEEVTGRKFSLKSVDLFIFTGEMTYLREHCSADVVWASENGYAWEIGGGMPVQDVLGFGYIVYGFDEQKNPMSFRAYIDMTDAPRK